MKPFCRFPLYIHCWGGFGSQLHTYAFAIKCRELEPDRPIRIIFHTSGVTRRELEIDFLLNDFDFEIMDDFESHNLVDVIKTGISAKEIFFKIGKDILYRTKLVSPDNLNGVLTSIRPLTFSYRGHYSRIRYQEEFYFKIREDLQHALSGLLSECNFSNTLIVHYRLGDLLTINKATTDTDSLISKIVRVAQADIELKEIQIVSDSPEIAKELLESRLNILLPNFKPRFINLNIKEVFVASLQAKKFIGTTSKISIWIAVLRNQNSNNFYSFLPIQLRPIVDDMLSLTSTHSIDFYNSIDFGVRGA